MKIETERDVSELLNSAKSLATVSAWHAAGLFDRLKTGPLPVSELPADGRAIATTLPVLAHLGLLATDGVRVGLTPTAERLLPENAMPTARNLELLADLGRMADVLRDGGPVKDVEGRRQATRGGTLAHDPAYTARFLDMLYGISEEPARSTFAWLAPGLPSRADVLDLGGGHGRYARVFADAGHRVTLFDQPIVIDIAKQRHGDALRYLAGDFHSAADFGGPYDLVIICNIVHGESFEQNTSMLARAAGSLKAGGRICVRDMFLSELGADSASAVFFGLTMLFYTEQGRSPTVRDTSDQLRRAGLVDPTVIATETHQMVIGRKPAVG